MTHVRTRLREAFLSRLTGLPLVGNNVFQSRIYNLREAECPAVCIYTEREDIQNKTPSSRQPAVQMRKIFTSLIIVVNVVELEVENKLDEISLLVENKIFEDPTFDGLAIQTSLLYAEKVITEVDRPVGMMRLTFESLLLTREGDAGKGLQQ